MYRLVIFTDSTSILGFKLAGVDAVEADSPEEVREKFSALLADPETGIIGMNENFLSYLDVRVRNSLEKMSRPVVVPIPAMGEKFTFSTKRDALQKMIKKAVGFDIKMGSE